MFATLDRDAREKSFWAVGSGLMPVRLSPLSLKSQYILLDGGQYDFCLDLTDENDNIANIYSAAWSSDVKNYISVHDDNVVVYNWSKNQAEKVKRSLVQDKFNAFLKILNANSYRTSDDVTPFILSLFAQLRNLTREQKEPTVALNLLFKLLVTLEEENLSQATCDAWGIDNVNQPKGFDALQESLRNGVRQISPNLDYILRHGSGPLFETAHREALFFDAQYNLFGGISSNLGYAAQPKYTGIHYTPRYLVRSIVENALKGIDLHKQSITILDPACGSGSFLQEVLKQLREKVLPGDIDIIVKGYDISSVAVQTASFLLKYENRKMWNNRIHLEILQQDALSVDWGQNDLILMNPPFISSELVKDDETKDRINQILADLNMKKRPNMAAAFLFKAIQSLDNNGMLGAVLPSSIFNQEQYGSMREMMHLTTKIETLAQLGSYVFGDALTDTSFVLARKQANNQQLPLNIWCSNREQSAFAAMRGWRIMQYEHSSECISEHYNIYTPTRFPLVRNSWKVLSKDNDVFLKQICLYLQDGSLMPLEKVFRVPQGIITGNNDLFKLNEEEYLTVPKRERRLYRPLASSKTISNGRVELNQYLWYPYSREGLLIKNEDELKKYEWSYRWLSPHQESLLTRKGVNNWWELTRPRADLFARNEPYLCSKRFGGAHSFAIAPAGSVVNEGNSFLFKDTNHWEDDLYFYLAFFSSSLFQRLLSIYARPLMAGYDMGNAQIKDIPIINVTKPGVRESESYCKLASLGREYAEGLSARRDLFDQYVMALYC